jgi:hypothetical protein
MAAILKFYRRDDKADQEDVNKLLGRFQYLLGVQRLWAIEWQEIADYTLPRKNSILVRKWPGQKRTARLFDSTAIQSRNKFASFINGGLTSGYMRWFYVETESDELNADQQTAIWLDQVGRLLLGDFNRSNFAQESGEAYIDVTTFANFCTYMEEIPPKKRGQFEGFRFKTEQPGQFAWSEGPDGMVNVVFREIFKSREAIMQEWPSTPEEKLGGMQNRDELLSIIHAVVPDEGRDDRWRSLNILENGKYKLSEKKYDDFPFLCGRWSKASGETYGRCPTHDALPAIRSLNKLREMGLRALPKIIDPPLSAVNGDVIGPARLVPGGVTNVRGSRESIGPLLPPGTFDLRQAAMTAEELAAEIRGHYHENELQFPEGQPQMTATEANARRELMQQLLGPTLGRMEKEFLHPLISRAFNIRKRANALPPLPPKLREAVARGKLSLRLVYDGTIARSQRSSELGSITGLIADATPLLQVDPAAADVIDGDETVRQLARMRGTPPQIIRDAGKTDQVRQVKAQQAQAQQQAAAQAQAAQSAGAAAPMVKAAGKAPETGSPLDQLANAQNNPQGQSQAA